MKKVCLVSALSLGLVLLFCSNPTKVTVDESALAAGKVFPAGISATVTAIQGSTVKTAACDAAGNYLIDNLVTGSCMLAISAKNYGTSRNLISLVGGQNEVKDITMGLLPFPITTVSPTPQSENVYIGTSVIMYFALPMDTVSFEKAFSLTPATGGIFTWTSNYTQMQFRPNTALAPSTSYKVAVDTSAKSIDGYHVEFSLGYTFTTTLFQVNFTSPQTLSENVSTSYQVNIYFNSPINDSSVLKAISISPSTDLNFTWNSEGCNLMPSSGVWESNTKYTITLDTSAKDIWGNSLQQPDTFVFFTMPFQVSNTSPQTLMNNFPVLQSVVFNFSAPMNDASIEKAMSVQPAAGLMFAWYSNGTSIIPAGGWRSNTKYTVTLDTSAKDVWGNPLLQPYTLVFYTAPFQVSASSPQTPAGNMSTASEVTFNFNATMNDSTVEKALSIQPATDLQFFWNSTGFSMLPLGQIWRSSTKYTVTIDTTASDASGSPLQQAFTYVFTTAPAGVNYLSPVSGERNVERTTAVVINFTTAMDTTVTVKAIKLTKSGDTTGIPVTFSVVGTYVMQFNPSSALDSLTEYTISIDTTAADIYGSAMPAAWSSSFTTR